MDSLKFAEGIVAGADGSVLTGGVHLVLWLVTVVMHFVTYGHLDHWDNPMSYPFNMDLVRAGLSLNVIGVVSIVFLFLFNNSGCIDKWFPKTRARFFVASVQTFAVVLAIGLATQLYVLLLATLDPESTFLKVSVASTAINTAAFTLFSVNALQMEALRVCKDGQKSVGVPYGAFPALVLALQCMSLDTMHDVPDLFTDLQKKVALAESLCNAIALFIVVFMVLAFETHNDSDHKKYYLKFMLANIARCVVVTLWAFSMALGLYKQTFSLLSPLTYTFAIGGSNLQIVLLAAGISYVSIPPEKLQRSASECHPLTHA